jgi:hypothetical protein
MKFLNIGIIPRTYIEGALEARGWRCRHGDMERCIGKLRNLNERHKIPCIKSNEERDGR